MSTQFFNNVKTALLLAVLTGIILVGGELIAGQRGLVIALVMAAGMNFASYFYSDRIALASAGAQEVGPDHPLYGIVERLAGRAGYIPQRQQDLGCGEIFAGAPVDAGRLGETGNEPLGQRGLAEVRGVAGLQRGGLVLVQRELDDLADDPGGQEDRDQDEERAEAGEYESDDAAHRPSRDRR